MFERFKQNKNNKENAEKDAKINVKKDNSKVNIGRGIALENTVKTTTAEANAKYNRPDYNPNTRKAYYDNPSSHQNAINKELSKSKITRDPYTNAELVKSQKEAKLRFGKNWQEHAAEADHKVPLHQVHKKLSKFNFLTTDDERNIGNNPDNFQVISRSSNQTSKMGKGGQTQKQWAANDEAMNELEKHLHSNEDISVVRKRIADTGKDADKRIIKEARKTNFKNAASTVHDSGMETAKNSGTFALTISGITNLISVIKGEKSSSEAISDTIKDGGKAAASGYAMGGGLTALEHSMSNSTSQLIKSLADANVPAKIISAAIITGDTLKKWCSGEINTQECIIALGDKGLSTITAGYFTTVGQALIPIPVLGGAIGCFIGIALTSSYYNKLVGVLMQKKQLEHEERLRIINECQIATEQLKKYNYELNEYLSNYLKEYREFFDTATNELENAFNSGDADGVICASNKITIKLGGNVKYNSVDEFKVFLNSDVVDSF